MRGGVQADTTSKTNNISVRNTSSTSVSTDLTETKATAFKTVGGYSYLSLSEKEGYWNRIANASDSQSVNEVLNEATGKSNDNRESIITYRNGREAETAKDKMRYVSDAEREDLNEQFGASTTTDQIDQIYNQANAINLMNTASAMDTDISDAKAAVKTYVNSLPNLGDDRAGLLERINSGNLRDVAKAFNDAKTTDAQNLKTTQTNAKAKINNDLNRFNQDGKNFFKDQIDQMTTNDDVQSMLDFAVSYNKAPVSINIEYVDENSNVIHAGKTLNGKLLGDSFDARPV